MSLEDCLPVELRGATTTITRTGGGLSGAAVYRVAAGERAFVLKLSDEHEPLADWQRKLRLQTLAAGEGLAPRVVHSDETRRAILSAFVVDRSFPALYMNPATRETAIAALGRTLGRLHALPLPPDTPAKDARELLAALMAGLAAARLALPSFAGDAVRRVLAEAPPPPTGAPVLSHNDVNPSNLAWDGEQIVLLDWDTAGANDPMYDLAAVAVFLRMDDETCLRLLAAHDGAPPAALPARFAYSRRLVAVFCGTMMLHLARLGGHAGASGDETLESTLSLADFYGRLRAGAISPATVEGQWCFGLALLKDSTSL